MDNIFIRAVPARNIRIDNSKSAKKIDGAIAAVMALDSAIMCGNSNEKSVYDSRGLLFL